MVADHAIQPSPLGALTRTSVDVLEHAGQMRGWHLECVQLSAGVFNGVVQEIQLDNFQIIREETNQVLIKRGASWPNSIVLSLPVDASGQAWVGGRELPSKATLLTDGSDLPELRTPLQLDLICIAINQRWFALRAVEAGYPALADHVWRLERFAIPEDQRSRLGSLILAFFEQAEQRPSILTHTASRDAMEDALLIMLLGALDQSVLVTLPDDTQRKQLADRVRHLMMRDPSEAPNLIEVCRRLAISRAHLQNCFQLSYGLTATQMIRAARLHGFRRELIDAHRAGRTVSIGDIAARWGFWHWSRFTGDYRRQFGELPSATVRRTRQVNPH